MENARSPRRNRATSEQYETVVWVGEFKVSSACQKISGQHFPANCQLWFRVKRLDPN
jgi:hypothetical protein